MNILEQTQRNIKLDVEKKVLEVAEQGIEAATLGTCTPDELVTYCRKVANEICDITGINTGGVYVL